MNIDIRFRKFIAKNFKNAYKRFLAKVIYNDEDMVKSIFAIKEIDKEFDLITKSVFSGNKCNLSKYESLTGDKYLNAYLKIFTFYIKSTYQSDMVTLGKYTPGKILEDELGNSYASTEEKYLSRLEHVCQKNFSVMYPDLLNDNPWWEYESATTLRKTIIATGLVIPISVVQHMAIKYLDRKIDIKKELLGKSEDTIKLINELDKKMAERQEPPIYAWFEEGKIKSSFQKPTDGRYCFVKYCGDIEFIHSHNIRQKDQELLK